MSLRIEIAADEGARALLEDEGFAARWRALAAGDAKLTLLQEPEFVRPWYQVYAATHAPLLVLGRAPGGELVGLLPLAQERDSGALVHAGAHQAEYHGWIARAEHEPAFVVQALLELRRVVGFGSWSWRWLPPGAPSEWSASAELGAAGIHVVREDRAAPVWDLRERSKLDKLLGSSAIRSKVNRYKRRGEYRLERIQDPERARALLPVLARQCDFRQEVIHGVRPFADDPRKAEFYGARLAQPGANHFSVLWCGASPVAFHHGAFGRGTCLLGLTAYDPSESRHSPGTLLLVELARSLTAEGCRELDLTPGTDPYKLRFANGERSLCRLTLHASRLGRWRSRASVGVRKRLLAAAASRDLALQERLQRWKRALGRTTGDLAHGRLARLARRTGRGLWERRSYACFTRPGGALPEADGIEVRVQAYEELLEPGGGAGPPRRELLAEALERFSDGETLYTVRMDGRLALLGWRTGSAGRALPGELQRLGLLREGAILLYGFQGLGAAPAPRAFRACVRRMLADVPPEAQGPVILCLEEPEEARRTALEALGFRAHGVAVHRRALGRPGSWRLEGAAPAGEAP